MSSSYPQEKFRHTTFDPSSFWGKRRSIVRKNTLPAQLDILKSTGRYDAFRLKWHPAYEDGHKALFWDSDVGKWLEGACYFLSEQDEDEADAVIDHAVKELTEMIRDAQWKDGYLNIFFTVVKPGERFTNLRDLHELYNAGHLVEAALAHHQHYNNDDLLGPMLKYVELAYETFGPGPDQIHGYPGHPEIELALLRLHNRTGNIHAYELARYFITERGNQHGVQGKRFYLVEAQQRGEKPGDRPDSWPTSNSYWYQQAHKPILEQQTVEGHSVRAMYLLTAVADLVRQSQIVEGDSRKFSEYQVACERLWDNMVNKKMYLTGGIGAIDQWEGFGIDYFLPQSTDEGGCYAETCASIGVMMLAERMLQLNLNGKYGDIMELALYNTVLGSMSQNGKGFLYENHLASCPARPLKREDWFDCACCPPNLTRTFGMLGGYLWSSKVQGNDVTINVHLYTSAVLELDVGGKKLKLKQSTNWPWGGAVNFTLDAPSDLEVTINLRIPGWTKPFKSGEVFNLLPKPSTPINIEKSYLTLPPIYTSQHRNRPITFAFHKSSFAPRMIRQHSATNQNTLTIARGPLIYCAEDIDNTWWVDDHFRSVRISSETVLEEHIGHNELLNEDYIKIVGNGLRLHEDRLLNRAVGAFPGFEVGDEKLAVEEEVNIVFIPYFYRGNRGGKGHMRVGFRRN